MVLNLLNGDLSPEAISVNVVQSRDRAATVYTKHTFDVNSRYGRRKAIAAVQSSSGMSRASERMKVKEEECMVRHVSRIQPSISSCSQTLKNAHGLMYDATT